MCNISLNNGGKALTCSSIYELSMPIRGGGARRRCHRHRVVIERMYVIKLLNVNIEMIVEVLSREPA